MISKKELKEYIRNIPPKPDILDRVIKEVLNNNLKKASEIAKEDPILVKYLQKLINKPVFGFKHKITDVTQIFTILGTDSIYELLHHYLLSLFSLKEWKVFKMTDDIFYDLQADLSVNWRKVLDYENIKDFNIIQAITLIPLSIIVCDELFYRSHNELELLGETSILDYNFLLEELTGIELKHISIKIGKYWGFSQIALDIIEASTKTDKIKDKQILRLGQWAHLLLFYALSKPIFMENNLNTFLKFDVEYIQSIYKDFENILGQEHETSY